MPWFGRGVPQYGKYEMPSLLLMFITKTGNSLLAPIIPLNTSFKNENLLTLTPWKIIIWLSFGPLTSFCTLWEVEKKNSHLRATWQSNIGSCPGYIILCSKPKNRHHPRWKEWSLYLWDTKWSESTLPEKANLSLQMISHNKQRF